MSDQPNERRCAILEYIKGYIADRGYAPTLREMATVFDTSTSAISFHVKALAEDGKLRLTPEIARGIVLVPESISAHAGNLASEEQPAPTQMQQSQPVLPYLLYLLLDNGRAALGADLEARAQLGLQRYGTPLMTHNGRMPLADLYQELLDALMYLAQHQAETGEVSSEFYTLKRVTMNIKAKLDGTAQVELATLGALPGRKA